MKHVMLATALLCMLPAWSCSDNSDVETPVPPTPDQGAHFETSDSIQSIPLPPVGQRWVINTPFSDEFNGSSLDKEKWLDYHPWWVGREPGIFKPSNIHVKDGFLVLEGEKLKQDTIVKGITYSIGGAAVLSKSQEAHYGYYECRVKANKTTLSTTFWLSSKGPEGTFNTDGIQPPGKLYADHAAKNPCLVDGGRFSQELDIMECIGRSGDFSGKFFADGMNSNIHFWVTPKGGKKMDVRAPETRLKRPDGKKPSDDFNVYGCWWKDRSEVAFYLNNGQEREVKLIDKTTKNDFYMSQPMGLNLVVETYPYPWIELPNDAELADEKKNKSYYDWVRSYILKPVDVKVKPTPQMPMFEEHVHFVKRSVAPGSEKILLDFAYTCPQDAKIELSLYRTQEEKVSTVTLDALAGYGHYTHSFPADELTDKASYYAVAKLISTSNPQKVYETDSFKFTY